MITIADVRRQANPALQMALTLAMWNTRKPPYLEWVSLVEAAIARAMDDLAGRRNYLSEYGEDALTQTVCMALRGGGLNAHSAMVNGNCDVTVDFNDYSWLGEAKIADDVNEIYGGYLQLTARYAKGTPGNTSMGMLLYCIGFQATAVMEGWRAALLAQVPHSCPRDCAPPHPLQFRSDEVCSSSGLALQVFHVATPMKHDPKEEVLKLTPKAREAGRKAKANAKTKAA